ncbi:MAG TPA: CBS domain-containing protein [Sphingomonadaceae bacterium]|nr:CBS domain-containing protein [Sphingomonadaceae bacterium]
MNVADVMTSQVETITPDQTVGEAAQLMQQLDTGVLPVGENDRLVGMVTDRDIVVRVLANGRGPDAPVREAMTESVLYCFEDDSIEDAARQMGDAQVRRLPVMNRDKRLVGIIALGDLALAADSGVVDAAITGISERPEERGDD